MHAERSKLFYLLLPFNSPLMLPMHTYYEPLLMEKCKLQDSSSSSATQNKEV